MGGTCDILFEEQARGVPRIVRGNRHGACCTLLGGTGTGRVVYCLGRIDWEAGVSLLAS